MSLPAVLFEDDLATALQTSTRTLRRLRRSGALAKLGLPELPSLDRKVRWSGAVVQQWLDGNAHGMTTKLRRVG